MRCEQPKHSDGASDWERLEQFDEQTGLNPTPVRLRGGSILRTFLRTLSVIYEKGVPRNPENPCCC